MAEPLYCSWCQEEITNSTHSAANGLAACSEECAARLDDPRGDSVKAADFQAEKGELDRALRRIFSSGVSRPGKDDSDMPF